MNVSTNLDESVKTKSTSSLSSSLSGHVSTEDDSEEFSLTYPSLTAQENEFVKTSLNITNSAGLEEAVERCKEFVLESAEWSDERKWLVHHLIELRMRLQEVKALESASQTSNVDGSSSMKEEHVIMGHHLFLQLPTKSTIRCCCCSGFIWSFLNHFYQCRDCTYKCHVTCLNKVKRLCTNVSLLKSPNYIYNICPEVGLSAQGFKCYECKAHITFTFPSSISWYGWPFSSENSLVEPRQCDYDGHYYCPKCHWNDSALIPARVVRNWDFVERPVCCSCSEYLKTMLTRPIINMDELNPQLFGLVVELSNVKKLRSELLLMKQYLTNCPEALKKRLVWCLRPHFVDGAPGVFSLEDLSELQRGDLFPLLQKAASVFTTHITENCLICRAKGYFCEFCMGKSKEHDRFFPFDAMVSQCAKCSALFHRSCWSKDDECPKCKRLQDREKLSSSDEVDENV